MKGDYSIGVYDKLSSISESLSPPFRNLADMETDNDGQVVIYTGVYKHSDGSFHDYKEVDPDETKDG